MSLVCRTLKPSPLSCLAENRGRPFFLSGGSPRAQGAEGPGVLQGRCQPGPAPASLFPRIWRQLSAEQYLLLG